MNPLLQFYSTEHILFPSALNCILLCCTKCLLKILFSAHQLSKGYAHETLLGISAVPVPNQNRSTLPVRALLHSATFFYPVYFFITHLFNCTPFAVLLASSEVAFDAYQHLSNTVQPFFCCFFHCAFFVCLPRCHS